MQGSAVPSTSHLQILGGVSCQLKHLSGQVLCRAQTASTAEDTVRQLMIAFCTSTTRLRRPTDSAHSCSNAFHISTASLTQDGSCVHGSGGTNTTICCHASLQSKTESDARWHKHENGSWYHVAALCRKNRPRQAVHGPHAP